MKYRSNNKIVVPHGNSSAWRYMAHWKFEKLIENSELFFSNSTKLSDQYEVTIPESTLKSKAKQLKNDGFKGRDLEEEMARFHWEANPMKDLVLVNCWSVSPHESYALWKIYLGGENDGIAIKSTVGALKKSITVGHDPYPEDFYIGKVQYKTHLKLDEISRFSVVTTKKPYYDFEKEMRLFILNYPISEGGVRPPYDIHRGRTVKVDLKTLIHEVYISPFSNDGYVKEVSNMLKANKFRLSKIKKSEIMDE